MDNELIAYLDDIAVDVVSRSGVPHSAIQCAGFVTPFFDPQQPSRPMLQTADHQRFTIDSRFHTQLAHRLIGGTPVDNTTRWGSGGPIKFNLEAQLIVSTRDVRLLPHLLREFQYAEDLQIRSFVTDPIRVMAESFLFKPSSNTPYDPTLTFFSVQYSLLSLSERIFALICDPE